MSKLLTFPNPAVATDISITMPKSASAGGTAISCTTNGTTTLTSAALFGSVFPGMAISGPGIPDGTTVASIASASSLTLSAAATDSTTGNRAFSFDRAAFLLTAVHFLLTTDANAANRLVHLIIDDGTTNIWVPFNDVVQTANLAADYGYAHACGGDSAPATTSIARVAAIPQGLVLQPGYRIRTSTLLKQAGDQFSAISILTNEVGVRA